MARSRPNEYPPLTAQRNPSRCREGLFFLVGGQDCFALSLRSSNLEVRLSPHRHFVAPFDSCRPSRHKKTLLASEKGFIWSAYGDGITNRLIHCVQGYAPSLRDAPLLCAPSNFLKMAEHPHWTCEDAITFRGEADNPQLEQCAAR